MISKSRLQLYPSKDIKDRAYIIGERSALLALSEALRKAATGVLGCETLTVYSSNGHDYEIFVTRDVQEDEWQNLPNNPVTLKSIQDYDEIKQELQLKQKGS
jgi:hypothetical protein